MDHGYIVLSLKPMGNRGCICSSITVCYIVNISEANEDNILRIRELEFRRCIASTEGGRIYGIEPYI